MVIKLLKIGLLCAAGFAAVFVLYLLFMVVTEYRPHDVEAARVIKETEREVATGEKLTLTTYNIGYCGLDQGRDFFMDGGKTSKSESREKTLENMKAVTGFLKSTSSDFYTLQEVDEKATRSYGIDEVQAFGAAMKSYSQAFAYNYKTFWVPLPVLDPMGGVQAGLMTLSNRKIETATRYSLPGDEPVPKRYFDLKRCVLETVVPVKGGKKLYLINLHLSAFDKGGKIRAQQIKWLENRVQQLEKEGHYVILSGDWNHLLSKAFKESYKGKLPGWVALLPKELTQLDFTLAYDDRVHTIRATNTPYIKGKNFETIIDGFFVSNNIDIIETTGHDLGFVHTDHNPVTLTFILK